MSLDAQNRIRDLKGGRTTESPQGEASKPSDSSERIRDLSRPPLGIIGVRLRTTSRPPTNGARASTRIHPLSAHRKWQCSGPSGVACHDHPSFLYEGSMRVEKRKRQGSNRPPSLRVEARGLPLHLNPSPRMVKKPLNECHTPSRPRGLHPAGALARTHRRKRPSK